MTREPRPGNRRVPGVLVLAVLCLTGCFENGPFPILFNPSHNILQRLVEEIAPSIIHLRVTDGNIIRHGTAVVFDNDRHVLTVAHHISANAVIEGFRSNGERVDVIVVAADPLTDVAVLRVRGDFPLPPWKAWRDSDKTAVGEWVMAVGLPFRGSPVGTVGVVNSTDRYMPFVDTYEFPYHTWFQVDADIQPEMEGGPCLDSGRKIVGLSTFHVGSLAGPGTNLVLPANVALGMARQLLTGDKPVRSTLGVEWGYGGHNRVLGGAVVERVVPGLPAAATGLLPGDAVIRVNGEMASIQNNRDFVAFVNRLANIPVGGEAEIEFVRGAESKTARLRAGERTHYEGAGFECPAWGLVFKDIRSIGWMEAEGAETGAFVSAITPAGPAEQAQLQAGDILRQVEIRDADLGRVKIQNLDGLRKIYEKSLERKSKQIFLEIKRGNAYRFVWLVPDYKKTHP
ncbi:MAG: trypsin-like peptidase domain-containing protein [Planctomycetota bacterium]